MNIKKIYIIVGIVSLVLFLAVFVFSKGGSKNTVSNLENTHNSSSTTLTPTPQNIKDIKIVNTTPENNEVHVLTNPAISFYFQDILSEENKKMISIETTPSFSFDVDWTNNKTLNIKPKQELLTDKKYTLTVKASTSSIFTLAFTTSIYTVKEANEQIQIQIEDDLRFTKSVYDFTNENPWYKQLPIVTNDYIVVYDSTNRKFVIGLSENLSTAARETKTNEAVESIKKIYPGLTDTEYYVYGQ